ncbi:Chordin-like protein 2 [Gossypium arboreum]|uniref:Chordin-like protein 2 n=1 Tax=Gossypium arboreum TaxID=29729 RepID=A0A0B0NAD9_GOSAR|nr:Chordin-like protein 2 [Gossypium arboreum]
MRGRLNNEDLGASNRIFSHVFATPSPKVSLRFFRQWDTQDLFNHYFWKDNLKFMESGIRASLKTEMLVPVPTFQ